MQVLPLIEQRTVVLWLHVDVALGLVVQHLGVCKVVVGDALVQLGFLQVAQVAVLLTDLARMYVVRVLLLQVDMPQVQVQCSSVMRM